MLTLAVPALGEGALSQSDALAVGAWLLETGLAYDEADRRAPHETRPGALEDALRVNPLWLKLPLVRRFGWLDRLLPWLGWLYSGPAAVGMLVLSLLAALSLAAEWERFTASSRGILAPGNWLCLATVWLMLKLLHELSHGLVCRRYGGEVREAGVILVLLAPLAYVDVTSTWRFRSRWQRIHTAAAGMYIELVVAAVAAVCWRQTTSPVAAHLLYNVIFMAGVNTLVFNANPLMRLDGYYILSDALDIPNLYQRGVQSVIDVARRILAGLPPRSCASRGPRALHSRVWSGGLVVAARCLCRTGSRGGHHVRRRRSGAGRSRRAGMDWPPAAGACAMAARSGRGGSGGPARFVARTLVLLPAGGLLLFAAPWPGAVNCPAIIEHSTVVVVRSPASAFVRQIDVTDGQWVESGQRLVVLSNEELESECRDLALAIEQSHAKRRMHLEQDQIAEAQMEAGDGQALGQRFAEKQRQRERLTVRAPIAGRVMGRNLELMRMTYRAEGAELLTLADDRRQEMQVAVAPEHVEQVSQVIGRAVTVRIPSRGALTGRFTRLSPRATKTAPHPGLVASHGGPLAVAMGNETLNGEDGDELAEPHFTGFVELPTDSLPWVQAGEVGTISFRPFGKSLIESLTHDLRQWVRRRISALTQPNHAVPQP